MKKLIFILLLFIGQFCFSQVDFNRKDSLSMDNEIVPYIEEFIEDAKVRGFYVRSFLIQRIDYMYFDNSIGTSEGDNRLGVVGLDKRGFYLSPRLRGNPIKLRLTIYHEIGHIIKQTGEHTCNSCYDIMSATASPDLKAYTNHKFWNLKLDEYFEWLNKKE